MSVAHADFMRVTDSLGKRAEKAEAERDEALAKVAVLVEALEDLQFGEGDERCWCVTDSRRERHSPRCQKAQAALSPDQKP